MLTRKKALQICRALWSWLAKTGSKRKDNWPGWVWNGGKHDSMYELCPCCEYDNLFQNKTCERCPLRGEWGIKGEERQTLCNTNHALFAKWCRARSKADRKKYAQMIANAARRQLSRYKTKEK